MDTWGKEFKTEQPVQRPWGKNVPTVTSGNSKEAKVAGVEKTKGSVVGDDLREVRGWGPITQASWLP